MSGRLPFQPSNVSAPEFLMQLGGADYSLVVTWNVSAQRYYFNLYDGSGVWVVTAPLIATAPGRKLLDMAYDADLRAVVATIDLEPWDPEGDTAYVKRPWRPVGQVIDYTLEGATPAWLNGLHRSLIIDTDRFMFGVAANPWATVDPGQISLTGSVHRYVNLVLGYVPGATLIFRNEWFEFS